MRSKYRLIRNLLLSCWLLGSAFLFFFPPWWVETVNDAVFGEWHSTEFWGFHYRYSFLDLPSLQQITARTKHFYDPKFNHVVRVYPGGTFLLLFLAILVILILFLLRIAETRRILMRKGYTGVLIVRSLLVFLSRRTYCIDRIPRRDDFLIVPGYADGNAPSFVSFLRSLDLERKYRSR